MSEFSFVRQFDERDSCLYELYHENSKLNVLWRPKSLTTEQIYITSRSVRAATGGEIVAVAQQSGTSALGEVVARRRSAKSLAGPISFDDLSALIRASAAVTGSLQEGDGPYFAIRAAPSGGGLYPIDLFIVALSCEGLARGVYYFHPFHETLARLPGANPDRIVEQGYFSQSLVAGAAAVLLMVASFKRSTWKYGERGYRLCLLDAGHMAENTVLRATELGCLSTPVAGFNDDLIASELGCDGVTEAVVHSVVVGGRNPDAV